MNPEQGTDDTTLETERPATDPGPAKESYDQRSRPRHWLSTAFLTRNGLLAGVAIAAAGLVALLGLAVWWDSYGWALVLVVPILVLVV